MKFKMNNGYVETNGLPLGKGANFETYRGKLYNSTFEEGKSVILKIYAPNGFETEEIVKDEVIIGKRLLASQLVSDGFINKFQRTVDKLNDLKSLEEFSKIKDCIVDLYDVDAALIDEGFNEITSESDVKSIYGFRCFSIYYDDNFNHDDCIGYQEIGNPEDAIEISIEIAEIIKKLHAYGYFHRDIKPSNFLYKPSGAHGFTVKMLDTDTIIKASDFKKNNPYYSAAYFSPSEVYRGEYYFESDLFMLAAAFLNLLIGKSFYDIKTLSNNAFDFGAINIASLSIAELEEITKAHSFSKGFILKLNEIINKYLTNRHLSRRKYTVESFISDLQILYEIYTKSKAQPQLLIDGAIAKITEFEYNEMFVASVKTSENEN